MRRAVAKLKVHHSKDTIALALVESKMAETGQTWRCVNCMKVCGKSHQFCGVCGQSWHLCADPSFPSSAKPLPGQARQVQWNYANDWDTEHAMAESWDQSQYPWPSSPRRRQTPRRRSNRRKNNAKDQPLAAPPKGKGKQQPPDPPLGPPTAATLATSSADAPWLSVLNAGASAVPMSHPTHEDKSMKAIMNLLRKHTESLPAELQAMVNDVSIKDGQTETKQMHSAVAAHGRAKKELQQAQLARFHLHAAWRGFLSQAVAQWQTYSDQFVAQEKQMTERVTAAFEALEQAKLNLATTKTAAGLDLKEDQMVISDDDNVKQDKATSNSTADRIKEGIDNLHTSLDALRTSAEQMVEEEHKALKRPRLDPGTTEAMPSGNGDNSGF